MNEEKDPMTLLPVHVMCRVYSQEQSIPSDFQLNSQYLFIYDRNMIRYFDINQEFSTQNLHKIGLYVDENQDEQKITQIRVSNIPEIIAIVLDQEDGKVIFEWNIKLNRETTTHDVPD